jgi:phage shock protein PspC (stress-responsive transcriptional regulator)
MLKGMSGAADASRPHGLGGFEETLKDFWVSRPRRPARGRKIAGVAAGIGNRYGIDPVIVRVALVAATVFGGVGLALYLLGWLFFPGEHDQVSPIEALFGRGRSETSKGFTIVLAIAFFPVISWAFAGGWFSGGGIIGLALLVTALYLLHRGRGQDYRPVTDTTSFAMSAPGVTTETPGWDPLGAAPLAWDLPEAEPAPSPPPPPRPKPARRSRSKVGVATFGVALLVAGAGAAAAGVGATWFSPQHIVGLALGVVGIGLVAGAFLRGGRGLIGLAIPLSIAGLVLTAVPVTDYGGGFGDINAAPTTAADVQPVYQHTAGHVRLDLSALPATTPVTTDVRAGAGTTTITVPETADVRFSCEVEAGNANCLGHETNGVGRPAVTGLDTGTDGPGGLQLNVKVSQGAGDVEVRRG